MKGKLSCKVRVSGILNKFEIFFLLHHTHIEGTCSLYTYFSYIIILYILIPVVTELPVNVYGTGTDGIL